jgi:flagellar biosynthesis/type III secretory pathway protein FliH
MGVISRADFERLRRAAQEERGALEAQADAARDAARHDGYREGLHEAREMALALLADDLASLRQSLDEAHSALVAELAQLVRRALTLLAEGPVPDGFVEAAVLQAVSDAGGLVPVRLLVSFEDEAHLKEGPVGASGVTIARDAQLNPGEMVVETPRGRHAIGWLAQLTEIADSLADGPDG